MGVRLSFRKPTVFCLGLLVLSSIPLACQTRRFNTGVRSTHNSQKIEVLRPLTINGKIVEAPSPYLTSDNLSRNDLAVANLTKNAEHWVQKKNDFTEELYMMGMDFIKKGKSGMYDTPFAVPVEPMVATIDRQWLNDSANASAEWLRVCKAVLQIAYSYPKPDKWEQEKKAYIEATKKMVKEKLGLSADTTHDALITSLMERIGSSKYLFPSFVNESMNDYPFLAITGWDAIVSKMERAEGFNFEVNAGTPSGLSNLAAMIEVLKKTDKEQADKLTKALQEDDTFSEFRNVIKSSAKAWTRRDGLAVVVGPGEYNGAHPDVATISWLTGMPMVKENDLQMGLDGFVHLVLPDGTLSPQPVTAIYSRSEESFLFQEGNDLREKAIPMVQAFIDNSKVPKGKNQKGDLLDSYWYEYLYDGTGSAPIGVKLGAGGEPLLAQNQSKVFTHNSFSLRKLVLERKLYVNLIGGRVIDDKQIFKIIADLATAISPGKLVGGPPTTLSDTEYSKLQAEPENYVVKKTDGSGGDGVYVMRNLSPREKEKIIQQVLDSEGQGYTIQRFTPSLSHPTVSFDGREPPVFTQLLGDLRIFVYFYPDNRAYTGNRGFLYRIAPFDPKGTAPGDPWSMPMANTSQGGGYGILAVEGDSKQYSPDAPPKRIASKRSKELLQEFLQLVSEFSGKVANGAIPNDEQKLKKLAFAQKGAMHLLGWKSAPLRVWANRQLAQELKDPRDSFYNALWQFTESLQATNNGLENAQIRASGEGCNRQAQVTAKAAQYGGCALTAL